MLPRVTGMESPGSVECAHTWGKALFIDWIYKCVSTCASHTMQNGGLRVDVVEPYYSERTVHAVTISCTCPRVGIKYCYGSWEGSSESAWQRTPLCILGFVSQKHHCEPVNIYAGCQWEIASQLALQFRNGNYNCSITTSVVSNNVVEKHMPEWLWTTVTMIIGL